MVNLREILELLADNTLKTGLPVPIPKNEIYEWAEPLGLKRDGDTYLFTGALYQLIPYIESLVKYLESMESKQRASKLLVKASRVLTSIPSLSKLALRPSKESIENSRRILRSIATLLNTAGVDYAYLYEDDMYSGILLYDLGLEEEFSRHARSVYEKLKTRGAKRILTVDPHTTHALREIYPKFIDGFDLEVINYIELLDTKLRVEPKTANKEIEVVIHDPCYYARFEGIIEQPRRLLRIAGIKPLEPKRTRDLTYCCGGPIEAISPHLSARIAKTRLEELSSVSTRIVTMCPICYSSLSRVASSGIEIKDIALYIAESLAGEKSLE
ncbi:MAG: (Fe-S)-binding protein [Desulfurococcales archaeon]|nr:(Fe-S)-binding protein [Desulfurococcales archaeon]